LHILLAEDNAVNQKLAIRLLEKRGHTVVVAANGRDALSALEKGFFDLVLMDVQMPEMDGLEATRLLRQKEKATETGVHQAVVAMTALAMKGDRERCLAAGMDGYLTKPIRPQELDEVLDHYRTRKSQDGASPAVQEVSDSREESVCMDELLERIDGDRSLLAELLAVLQETYPEQLRVARLAVATHDSATLQRVGHTLKGALGNLAAPIASALAGELETMGSSGTLAVAEGRVNALDDEVRRVIEALQGMCLEGVQ
jgi:two-component system sensor histidine kinase/response regulator